MQAARVRTITDVKNERASRSPRSVRQRSSLPVAEPSPPARLYSACSCLRYGGGGFLNVVQSNAVQMSETPRRHDASFEIVKGPDLASVATWRLTISLSEPTEHTGGNMPAIRT